MRHLGQGGRGGQGGYCLLDRLGTVQRSGPGHEFQQSVFIFLFSSLKEREREREPWALKLNWLTYYAASE